MVFLRARSARLNNKRYKDNKYLYFIMEVIKFELLTVEMPYDNLYNDGFAWSRVYEYPIVLNCIEQLKHKPNISIHNTSWGFEGVHITFKNKLDELTPHCIHSDIISSKLDKTIIYNIKEKPPKNFVNNFDFVLNISILPTDDLNCNQWLIIQNLYEQVKENGYLIITFDLPGLNVPLIEHKLATKLKYPKNNILNGSTSLLANPTHSKLNCGLLVIKKNIPISVIIDTCKQVNHLTEQIKTICSQTIKPHEIIIWNNSLQQSIDLDSGTSNNSNKWSKFFAAFNCTGKYICIVNDNILLDENWFKNCLNRMKLKKGVYGTIGYRFSYNSWNIYEKIGYLSSSDNSDNEAIEVDVIKYNWIFKKKWLSNFIKDLPNLQKFKMWDEDIHFSYILRKYKNIQSYVIPYQKNNIGTCAYESIDNTFDETYRYYVYGMGYHLVKYIDIIKNENVIGPFKYEWAKVYNLIKYSKSLCFIRFGDGELALMNNRNIQKETQAFNVDKWSWISNTISTMGIEMINITKNEPDLNTYYAFATSDNIEQTAKFLSIFKNSLYSIKNIGYANNFINSNFSLTKEFIYGDLLNSRLGTVVCICNEECINIGQCITEYVKFPNDIVYWWEQNHKEYKQKMCTLAKKYTNALFIFSVGPLSKILINIMYNENKNNRYVDFGSALDALLKKQTTRPYQSSNNWFSTLSDSIIDIEGMQLIKDPFTQKN